MHKTASQIFQGIPSKSGGSYCISKSKWQLFPRFGTYNSVRNGMTAFSTFPRLQQVIENSDLLPKRLPIPVFKYSQDRSRLDRFSYTSDNRSPTDSSNELVRIGTAAEKFLGTNRFSINSTLNDMIGNYYEIISLFTLRNSDENHPLFFLARILEAVADYKRGVNTVNPYPLWRQMMTLLAADMFGYSGKMQNVGLEVQRTTEDRHARLSKIVEIAYITQQIHKRILDCDSFPRPVCSGTGNKVIPNTSGVYEINNANKTATLVGDLLWSQICVHMAALNCQAVSEMICQFLMDYCEGEFAYKPQMLGQGQVSADAWFQKTQLGLGSIMGTTISAMLGFNGHGDHIRNSGYQLGMLLALCYQAHDDLVFFEKDTLDTPQWIDTGLLPLVFKIQEEPHILAEHRIQIFEKIKNDKNVQSKCYRTLTILQEDTLSFIRSLDQFISSPTSRKILEDFIISLHR